MIKLKCKGVAKSLRPHSELFEPDPYNSGGGIACTSIKKNIFLFSSSYLVVIY
jgi:hypothetical protein